MALISYGADFRPALQRKLTRTLDAAGRNVRLTAVISVFAMSACFAAATALDMRRDYAQALAMAGAFAQEQARTLASETAQQLGRLAALGHAYSQDTDSAETARIIKATHLDRFLNIALADADGHFIAAMDGRAESARPLASAVLQSAQRGESIQPFSDMAIGSSPLTLLFPVGGNRVIVMPLDPLSLLSKSTIAETGLFGRNGVALALAEGWENPPPAAAMRAEPGSAALRQFDDGELQRVVALAPVPGWPLTAAVSVRASAALDTWYGSLPLYLFVIIGPAIASAALAFLLVRECERADRARSALVAVKAIGNGWSPRATATEAELLTRLAESERRGAEAQRAKTEFIANMSHELRTPLNAIIGFAEIIKAGLFGPLGHEKYVEYADDIAKSGRDLHQRIGEILEFGAVEAGRQPLYMTAVDVGSLAKKCVDQAQGETLGRRIALDFTGPSLPPARADDSAVRRILILAMTNALRHTSDGGAIRVEARKDEDMIVVVIRDNGAGYVESERAHDQTNAASVVPLSTVSSSGLALGLSMAVGLARRMGGALRLSGTAGDGIWAELRLPLS